MTAKLADPGRQLPWRKFYGLQVWKDMRAHQLRIEPLCRMCKQEGRIVAASVADHIVPHRGDWNRFRLGELQSLCKPCHDGLSGFVHKGYRCDIGDDGFPLDPNHPFNRAGGGRGR